MIEDDILFGLIENENRRQHDGIELIASENYVSNQVLRAAGSILTNKYAEGYPSKRYYGGCEYVDQIERLAIDRVKKIFDVEYVNVQPHSGSQANAAVFAACLNPGDKILGFNLSHGGHLTHGSSVNFSGKIYEPYDYGVNSDTEMIDYDQILQVAKKVKPHMIIAGATAYSRDINFKKFREIADSVDALLLADISHPAGLIAKGLHSNPVPYCYIITTTTHKTLRGPRGGMIMVGKDYEYNKGTGRPKLMSSRLDSSVFPGIQGGPLMHIIAAKAAAFGEILTDEFSLYANQIIKNAKVLADCFIKRGYKIVSNGTDNHLMLLDLSNKNISGKDAEKQLGRAGITVNKNMIPFDSKSAFVTSGIRIGTSALTTRGLVENDMIQIVDYMDEVISSPYHTPTLNRIKDRVLNFMADRPLFV